MFLKECLLYDCGESSKVIAVNSNPYISRKLHIKLILYDGIEIIQDMIIIGSGGCILRKRSIIYEKHIGHKYSQVNSLINKYKYKLHKAYLRVPLFKLKVYYKLQSNNDN